jgi:hypothetical protein
MKLPNTIASQQQATKAWAKKHHVKIMKRYFDRNKPKKGEPLYPLYEQYQKHRAAHNGKTINHSPITTEQFCAMLKGNASLRRRALRVLEQILNNMDEVEYIKEQGYQLKSKPLLLNLAN